MTPALTGAGTPEAYWSSLERLAGLVRWTPAVPVSGRVVVVAPHPDDEVLGPGGTVLRLATAGARVVVAAVTDGEASHPGRAAELRRLRRVESEQALAVLGVSPGRGGVVRLGLPDGAVTAEQVADRLASLTEPGDLLLAPWDQDGHPDHDATGRAALDVARDRGGTLLQYLVWAWHWADERAIPWERARRVDLSREEADAKRAAAACHTSQTAGPDPILPPHVLVRVTRGFEVLLTP